MAINLLPIIVMIFPMLLIIAMISLMLHLPIIAMIFPILLIIAMSSLMLDLRHVTSILQGCSGVYEISVCHGHSDGYHLVKQQLNQCDHCFLDHN